MRPRTYARLNLFVGGPCIEDIGHLQHSEAIKQLLGACRISDPTTAGDFLRCFKVPNLNAFQMAIDEARQKVWRQMRDDRKQFATIDMDSTVKPVCGECKQGADFILYVKMVVSPIVADVGGDQ